MAQIHTARNDLAIKLKNTRRKNRTRPLIFFSIALVVCCILNRYVTTHSLHDFPALLRLVLLLFPPCFGLYSLIRIFGLLFSGKRRTQDEEGVLQSGLDGERTALSLLEKLGNDCHIFTNLRIPYQGREAETDLIVITPAGITIVEVKNSKGLITGDASDPELSQRKYLRNGDFHDKCFRNPFRQVGTHVYRLKGYLRQQGVQVPHIRTCAFFTNPEADLQITDKQDILREKCPVFLHNEGDRLIRYLCRSDTPFPGRACQKSVRALEALRKAGLKQG